MEVVMSSFIILHCSSYNIGKLIKSMIR